MADPEKSIKEYQEPDEADMVWLSNSDLVTDEAEPTYRIKTIYREGVVIEPLQEGVLHYPPVSVRPKEVNDSSK